jgi:hypothetical protein
MRPSNGSVQRARRTAHNPVSGSRLAPLPLTILRAMSDGGAVNVLSAPGARRGVLFACGALLGVGALAAGCSKKPEEPVSKPLGSAAFLSPSSEPPGDLKARKMAGVRLGPELCELGAKRVNTLNGHAETDRRGTHILELCLMRGSAAWYTCVLQAKTGDEANSCTRRLLLPQD